MRILAREATEFDCVLMPVMRVGGGVGWGKPLYKAVDFGGVKPERSWERDVYLWCVSIWSDIMKGGW